MGDRPKIPFLDAYDWVGSSSQIDTWSLCQRKWAYGKVDGIKDPGSKATALGTDVDDNYLQPYVRDGVEFDLTTEAGQIAAQLRPFLVKGSGKHECQKHIVIPSANPRIAYQGWIDMFAPGVVPTVSDFKTSGDLQWAKSADVLRTKDTQAILYAHWALRGGFTSVEDLVLTGAKDAASKTVYNTYPAAPHGGVNIEWLYTQTKGKRKAKRVHLQRWQGDTDEAFQRIDAIGHDIAKAKASTKTATDLPPNLDRAPDFRGRMSFVACDAFGGCSHREACHATIDRTIAPLNERLGTNDTMLNLDLLATLNANVNATAPTPAAAPSSVTLFPTPGAVPPPPTPVLPVGGLAPVPSLVTAPVAPPVVMVNPPESAIDPATVPAIVVAGEVAPATTTRRKRRTKAEIEAEERALMVAEAGQYENGAGPSDPMPTDYEAPAPATTDADYRDSGLVRYTHGEERYADKYCTCAIGPFEYETFCRPGETRSEAMTRLIAEATGLFAEVRAAKLASFRDVVAGLGK